MRAAIMALLALGPAALSLAGCGTIIVGTTAGVISAVGGGGGGGAAPGAPPDQPPAAAVSVAGDAFADLVTLEMTLLDPEGDPADVDVAFSTDGAAFAPATEARVFASEGTRGLAATALGTPHRFVWNALHDLGGADAAGARLRVTPRASPGGTAGAPAHTAPFAVLGSRISTLLGGAQLAGVDAASALAVDADGRLHVADANRAATFRFDPLTGVTVRFAGTGEAGRDPDDLPALESRLGAPRSLAAADGALYVADADIEASESGGRVARIDLATGFLTTLAGLGEGAVATTGSALATDVALASELSVAARDGAGLVFALQGDRATSATQKLVAVNATTSSLQVARGNVVGATSALGPGEITGINPAATRVEAIAAGPDGLLYLSSLGVATGPLRTVRSVLCFNPTAATISARVISAVTATASVSVRPGATALIVSVTAIPEPGLGGGANAGGATGRLAVDADGTIALLEVPGDRGARARLHLANRGPAPRVVSPGAQVLPGFVAEVPIPPQVDAAISTGFAPGGGLLFGSEQGRVVALATSTTAGTVLGIALAPGEAQQAPVFIDPDASGLSAPLGLALGPDGSLYVCDAAIGSPRTVPTARVLVVAPQGGPPLPFAGTGSPGLSGDGGSPLLARLSFPLDAAVKPVGDVLVADFGNGALRRVAPGDAGLTIETVGPPLPGIFSVAVDPSDGAVYAGDAALSRVVRFDLDAAGAHEAVLDGVPFPRVRVLAPEVLLVATGGTAPEVLCANLTDEPVRVAGIDVAPRDRASIVPPGRLGAVPSIDARDGLLVVAEADTNLVGAVNLGLAPRTVAGVVLPPGVLTTIAGTGRAHWNGDPLPAREANLDVPSAVAIRADGAIVIAEAVSGALRLLNPGPAPLTAGGREIPPGHIGTLAGAPGAAERTNEIWGASFDAGGGLLATTSRSIFTTFPGGDPQASFVYRLARAERAFTRLVGGASEETDPAPALRRVSLLLPTHAITDPARPLVIVADARAGLTTPQRIRLANLSGATFTAFGVEVPGGAVGTLPALAAAGTALARDGALYVPDYQQARLIRVAPDGATTTVLAAPEGPTTTAGIAIPGLHHVALFETEVETTVYASESHTGRVYRVRFPGTVPGATVLTSDPAALFVGLASNPTGVTFTGHALPREECALFAPSGIACDAEGVLYIADRGNNRIVAVNDGPEGVTVAGTFVPAGFAAKIAGAEDRRASYNGELVPPRNAHLTLPYGLAVSPEGDLVVTEPEAGRLRRFSTR